MGTRAATVEFVIRWFEDQLRLGRLKVGEPFPSERQLSRELRVSRSAVREAKSRMFGEGRLHHGRMQPQIAGRSGPDHFREWIASSWDAKADQRLALVRQALDFRRFALPEILAWATRRASKPVLTEIQELVGDFQFDVRFESSSEELASSHTKLIMISANRAKCPPIKALADSLAEALYPLPVWRATCANKHEWYSFFDELKRLIEAKKPGALRRLMRQRLASLDKKICAWLAEPSMPERLEF